MFRTGFGFDTHRLEVNHDFRLGGVLVPHEKGATGHSDADVLIHAICDAMLGAAGLRDIGTQFPDTSPEFRNIDSKVLLKRTLDLIQSKGYRIGNLDTTVVLQSPKISSFISEMVRTLAGVLETDESRISVKAKTSEKLGFIGREEGVSAYAIVLLETT
ncbi:MAG: 2-C-methyl-D-erythritol 2,4-cyclodiphosphate synthase [Bacteroidetes bacterium]|nr:2-C-methyl-D-erythritol 2,4-cyclodiphosphate synthase [Bacteroidota bacterium]